MKALKAARTVRRRRAGPMHDPAATRAALLAGGAEVFARRGFKGATADLIAAEAGVNKAMINYHFGGKAGLYEAILVSLVSEFRVRLEPLREPERSAAESIQGVARTWLEMARERPSLVSMLVQEVLSGGAHVGPDVFPHLVSIMGVTREIVDRGVRRGEFLAVDPVLVHFTVIGALAFFFATEPLRKRVLGQPGALRQPTAEAFVENLQQMIVRGLAPGPRARRAR